MNGSSIDSDTVKAAPPSYSRGGPPLYATDCGCVGDGVTDDADALDHFILNSQQVGRGAAIPAGVYMVSHPIGIPLHSHTYGVGSSILIGAGRNAVVIKPTADFGKNFGNNGAPLCVFQSDTWADQNYKSIPGAVLENLTVDCSLFPLAIGIGIHGMDDHSCIRNVSVIGAETGVMLTGTGGGNLLERVSFFKCKTGGIRITSHPLFSPGNSNGTYCIEHVYGDLNGLGLVLIEGAGLYVKVGHTRFEQPPTIKDNVVRFRQNLALKGTGQGGNGAARNCIQLCGNFSGMTLAGEIAQAVIGIDMTPGTTQNEWQRPSVEVMGYHGGFEYFVRDDPAGTELTGPAQGALLVGSSGYGWQKWCSDPQEK